MLSRIYGDDDIFGMQTSYACIVANSSNQEVIEFDERIGELGTANRVTLLMAAKATCRIYNEGKTRFWIVLVSYKRLPDADGGRDLHRSTIIGVGR